MKLTGNFYEFNVSYLKHIRKAITDLNEDMYDILPIKEGIIIENKVSIQYDSENFYSGTFIKGFIYDDKMDFLGKVHYKNGGMDVIDDIRGRFCRTENGLFIYGVWEYLEGKYGYAMELNHQI